MNLLYAVLIAMAVLGAILLVAAWRSSRRKRCDHDWVRTYEWANIEPITGLRVFRCSRCQSIQQRPLPQSRAPQVARPPQPGPPRSARPPAPTPRPASAAPRTSGYSSGQSGFDAATQAALYSSTTDYGGGSSSHSHHSGSHDSGSSSSSSSSSDSGGSSSGCGGGGGCGGG